MNVTALWTTIIGAIAAIGGGFAGSYLTQSMTNKAERRKRIREKVEEIYELIHQIKIWVRVELSKVDQIKSIRAIRVTDFGDYCEPAYLDTKFYVLHNSLFWLIDEKQNEVVCPIEKLETIVKIHIPKLAPDLSEYRDAIQDIVIVGNQIKNLMNIDPLIEEGDDNYNYAIEELANIRERCKRFEEEHKKLHLRLEKLASRF